MSWISDVRDEIIKLDLSKKSLRKFGLTVGIVLSASTLWLFYKDYLPSARYALGTFGLALIFAGLVLPVVLKPVYKIWMGIAFAIGWIVSRVLLTILFSFVMTPIGLIMRLAGKKTLDTKMNDSKDSYWIRKSKDKINYEKMY
ncbi:hypothetical protein JXJ21_23385 [candidate division KSB1 bacterium]|nr:hypothetical protein [candidate division KSB1 bacterium]